MDKRWPFGEKGNGLGAPRGPGGFLKRVFLAMRWMVITFHFFEVAGYMSNFEGWRPLESRKAK